MFLSLIIHSTNTGHQHAPDRVPDVWAMMEDRCQGPLPHGLTFEVCV